MSVDFTNVTSHLSRILNLKFLEVEDFPKQPEKGTVYYSTGNTGLFDVVHCLILGDKSCQVEISRGVDNFGKESSSFVRREGRIVSTNEESTTYAFNISFK